MKNLFAFVGMAIVTFVGLGWYLDWYKIQSDTGPTGHRNVNIDVNSPKIVGDVQKGVQKGEEQLQGVLDKKNPPSIDAAKPADNAPPSLSFPPPQDARLPDDR